MFVYRRVGIVSMVSSDVEFNGLNFPKATMIPELPTCLRVWYRYLLWPGFPERPFAVVEFMSGSQ